MRMHRPSSVTYVYQALKCVTVVGAIIKPFQIFYTFKHTAVTLHTRTHTHNIIHHTINHTSHTTLFQL